MFPKVKCVHWLCEPQHAENQQCHNVLISKLFRFLIDSETEKLRKQIGRWQNMKTMRKYKCATKWLNVEMAPSQQYLLISITCYKQEKQRKHAMLQQRRDDPA